MWILKTIIISSLFFCHISSININDRSDLCQCKVNNNDESMGRFFNGTIAEGYEMTRFIGIFYRKYHKFINETNPDVPVYTTICTTNVLNERWHLTAAHWHVL